MTSAGAHAVRFYAAVAAVVLAVATLAFVRGERSQPPTGAEPDAKAAPWCARGLEPVAGAGCHARASGPAPRPLVVYLHGLHTDARIDEELERQARVARIGTARGFDVLALRGRLGTCERLPDHYCWPSNERSAPQAPSFVDAWAPALAAAASRGAAGPRHLLGFSNGGYFASLVVTRGLAPFDAVVVAHGGPVEPVRPQRAMPPLLLLTADDDAALPDMMRLAGALTRERWPHAFVAREGGHALTDGDVVNAMTFFARARADRPAAIVASLAGHAPRPPRAAEAPSSDDEPGAPADDEARDAGAWPAPSATPSAAPDDESP